MKRNGILKKIMVVFLSLIMILSVLSGCTDEDAIAPETETETQTQVETQTGTETETKITYKPGTYTAEADGRNSVVKVEVTFSDSKIEDIKIISHSETAGLGDTAMEKIKELILSDQTLAVDTITGATVSSNAILLAVEDAVKQAGGNVDALKQKVAKKEGEGKTEKLEADVIVIGAGASGVSAAVAAADEGAKVILIEKTGIIGGASNLSWAGKFLNASVALENQVVANIEQIIDNWIENNHYRVDAAVLREYLTKSGETYDWLKDRGYETTFMNFFGEQMYLLPDYSVREPLLRKMLANSVEKNGGQVLTETTGKKLITDDSGSVIGVIAEKSDGTTLEIMGKSVVLATGGYAANKEMVKEFFGFEGVNGGLGQNIGEGLMMAWEVGAKVPDNIGGQMLHQTLARATQDLKKDFEPFKASYPVMLTYLPTLMNVGPSGSRFRDEAYTLNAVAAANTSAFHGPFHYVIVSKAQLDALEKEGMNGVKAPRLPGMPPEFYFDFTDKFTLDNPWEDVYKVFDKMVENGHGFKGDTIEELAKNAGMDVEVFVETFNNYEEACRTGKDLEFGKDPEYLIPMGDEGPYYAIIAEINNLGSVGGLLVNKKFQVLDNDRVPIKGLYAVGVEALGVLFNDTYVGNGDGIGFAFTSGRLGGMQAGKYALGKK